MKTLTILLTLIALLTIGCPKKQETVTPKEKAASTIIKKDKNIIVVPVKPKKDRCKSKKDSCE
jgi:hypothetical protein